MKKILIDTTYDRIHSYYQSGTSLTEKEDEIKKRWEAAHSLMLLYHSREQSVPILKARFEISNAQAYRDINSSLKLFGDINKSNKEGMRNIHYELAMQTYKMAKECKPPDLAEMNRANALAMKILGLDREDPEMPDFENLQPHVYIIANDPKTLGFLEIPNLEQELEKFKKKKAKQALDISDAELAD
jgi:hypothetical protein